ncbi:hydroxypyruvate reductase, partial [Acidovorax delafieldii 2AN]
MAAMHSPHDAPDPALPDFRTQPRAFLQALFEAAVRSAQPLHGMRAWLPAPPRGRTLVLG